MSVAPEACRKRARTISVIECRACLTKIYDDSCCVDLFRAWDPSWPGMGVSIAEDLAKLSNIQVCTTNFLHFTHIGGCFSEPLKI